jgi:hypothetical protein
VVAVNTLAAGDSFGTALGNFLTQLGDALRPLFTTTLPIPVGLVMLFGVVAVLMAKK